MAKFDYRNCFLILNIHLLQSNNFFSLIFFLSFLIFSLIATQKFFPRLYDDIARQWTIIEILSIL